MIDVTAVASDIVSMLQALTTLIRQSHCIRTRKGSTHIVSTHGSIHDATEMKWANGLGNESNVLACVTSTFILIDIHVYM